MYFLGSDRPGDVEIEGDCSCPVNYNCKHVAAVLLEALGQPQNKPVDTKGKRDAEIAAYLAPDRSGAVPVQPAGASPGGMTAGTQRWLDRLGRIAEGDNFPPNITQRLLYLIAPVTRGEGSAQLGVEVVSARLLKTGGYADKTAPQVFHHFDADRVARFYRAVDIDICQALTSHDRHSYGSNVLIIGGAAQAKLLADIVATGRAFWQTPTGSPLAMGSPRHGEIDWRMEDARGIRPVLMVEGCVTLNAEPPVYVDVEAGLIGEVQLPVSPRISHQLLSAPAIPPAQAATVATALRQVLPTGTGLAPKPPQPAIRVTDDPVAVLRLMVGKPYYDHYGSAGPVLAIAGLSFRYGPVRVEVTEARPIVDGFRDGRMYEAVRRPSLEKACVVQLFDSGMRAARKVYPNLDLRHQKDFAFPEATDWFNFLSRDVPRLQTAGFVIEIDAAFPYQLARPGGDFDAEIFQGSGLDWFELDLGVEVDGARLDLAPLLASLVTGFGFAPEMVRAAAEVGGDIFVPLADGRFIALAAQRFLPVILALHDLTLGGSLIGKNGRLQFSKAESLLLADIESQDGFVFKGMDSLRRMVALVRAEGIASVVVPDSFHATLRPYQAQGVAWLNFLRQAGLGGILADDMGLGKTVQLLALLALEKAEGRLDRPVLIVAPTSLMSNWRNEAQKFAPDLTVLTLQGADRKTRFDDIADHDIVLTTYPLIARDQAVLLEQDWHMAILDEAQVIKNPNAATTRMMRGLKARHRFCLTGTPMENHLGELWSLMTFVNPGFLGDQKAFTRMWRTPIEKQGNTARSQALARRVKPFMLRRTKQAVASELPPKTEIIESITLEGRQRDIYDSIRLSMHKKVRDAIAAKGLAKSHIIILEALLKLRQACCDPRLLKLDEETPAPSAKLERLMEMVQELLSEGRKIIVFSQFTSMLDLIVARLKAVEIGFSLLTGETKDRASAITDFQSGRTDVFLISLKAGGVGLNLTAADTVILYDPWWNPAVEEQAIDRAYRIGQDKPVFVYRLAASGTIEEKMDELKARKRALAESLFDQDGCPTLALSEDDLEALFEG